MLTSAATFSLLLSSAAAAAITNQQPFLIQDVSIQEVDHIDQMTFKKFAIEDMSDAKFLLHHHTAKALLGDESYLLLRKAEMEARESDVWGYLWDHELDCGDWMTEDEDDDNLYRERIYLSGGRVFDADTKRVPQDVIDALLDIEERDSVLRRESHRESSWGLDQAKDNEAGEEDVFAVPETDEPGLIVAVPEEYLQYQIPNSVLEEDIKARDDAWKARDEKRNQDILAGRVSVRNMKMPDFSKCERMEPIMWHEGY